MKTIDKYAQRLRTLIDQSTKIPVRTRQKLVSSNSLTGEKNYRTVSYLSSSEFVEWRTNCITLLDVVVPEWSIHRKAVDSFSELEGTPSALERAVAFLRAIRSDLEGDFLRLLSRQVDAELSADYLAQAEQLIQFGVSGSRGYIAAAVLAGATLEHGLRGLCLTLDPVEPVERDGTPLAMGALIDALKRRMVYNELEAKQLRAWADIRNAAAHGRFDDFGPEQADAMIHGVADFLRRIS